MPDADDDLNLLRNADPVDQAALPAPTTPEATALFERITMDQTTAAPEVPAQHRRPPRSRRALWVASAAAVLVAVALGGAALLRDDDPRSADELAEGPVVTPDPGTAMCVEVYDLQTLANREVAFDGTVTSIDGDTVTFAVEEWYRGGDTGEVSLQGAQALTSITSVGPAFVLEPGARFLVAGDGGFAWSCGFTQPYDATVADDWSRTFAG
jgi:hypothetical protein